MVETKEKKYIVDNPALMTEWDFEKNKLAGHFQETTALHSNKKMWWKCQNGHTWDMSPDKRIKAKGCPYCLNKRVWIGYNDLTTLFPKLSKEWDYEENKIDINSVVIGGTNKIHWVCSECQNKWIATVRSRTQHGSGCPVCAKRIGTISRLETLVSKHGCITNDLLLKEWHSKKNEELGLFPEKLTPYSNKYAWWICSICKHEWSAKIVNRSNGRGCPACSNKIVVAGLNDLCTTHPSLSKEWDYEKNGDLLPQNVSYGMGRKVGWICPIGHRYKATILHRSSGTNCPICNSGRQTSFAEQAVFYYVKEIYPNATSRYKDVFSNGMELDIYIPELHYAIEYDGSFWHKNSKYEREKRKYEICKSNNIKLVRIKAYREKYQTDIEYYADYTFFLKEDDYSELEKMIQELYFELYSFCNFNIRPDLRWEKAIKSVNLKRDRFKILNYLQISKDSFGYKYPELALEWHLDKNEKLTPYMFKSGSSFVAWWKCKTCGYEWKTSICHRVNGTGCKRCHLGKKHYKSKVIYQYTRDGEFVRKWESISNASKTLNINNSNIYMCAIGKRAIAGGYQWTFEYSETLESIVRQKKSKKGMWGKAVNQIDMQGNIINHFNSLNEAERQTGINATSISKSIHGRTKRAGGFLWKLDQ